MGKVLVIENDPQIQQLYREILLAYGYEVESAFTAENGIEKIKEYTPDIIILDMDLGSRLTGRDVVLSVKKIDKSLPIIVVSGKSGMKEDPEILLSKNVRHFFVKPVSMEQLIGAISREITLQQGIETVDIVPDYELGELIGTGGCGSVYKGRYFDKEVAIKILPISTSPNQSLERFRREAEYLAKIKHPAIVELYEHGQNDEGSYYIIMEYFIGCELGAMLNNEIFEEQEAAFIISKVAEGLSGAHNLGIIHRDIKPSNILYNRDKKEIKIIDFGIARQHEANHTITVADSVLGTPAFMSPEQCLGQKLQTTSDIYNLGATLYKMVTGVCPFVRPQIMQVMYAQVCEPLVWAKNCDVSEKMQKIVGKMMEKKPEDRYQSMEEVAENLGNF